MSLSNINTPQDNEDPEIGTLKVYMKSWEGNDNTLTFREIGTKFCKSEDFDANQSRFYP